MPEGPKDNINYLSISRATGAFRVTSIESVENDVLNHPAEFSIGGIALPTTSCRFDMTNDEKQDFANTVREASAYKFLSAMQQFNTSTTTEERRAAHERAVRAREDEQTAQRLVQQFRQAAFSSTGQKPDLLSAYQEMAQEFTGGVTIPSSKGASLSNRFH